MQTIKNVGTKINKIRMVFIWFQDSRLTWLDLLWYHKQINEYCVKNLEGFKIFGKAL